MKRLDRHPAVLEHDLPEIYACIAQDNPAATERVLGAVGKTFALIAERPESGVPYHSRNPLLHGLRMLPVIGYSNYLVFFRVGPDSVRLLYVVHGARHLKRYFNKERRQ